MSVDNQSRILVHTCAISASLYMSPHLQEEPKGHARAAYRPAAGMNAAHSLGCEGTCHGVHVRKTWHQWDNQIW